MSDNSSLDDKAKAKLKVETWKRAGPLLERFEHDECPLTSRSLVCRLKDK